MDSGTTDRDAAAPRGLDPDEPAAAVSKRDRRRQRARALTDDATDRMPLLATIIAAGQRDRGGGLLAGTIFTPITVAAFLNAALWRRRSAPTEEAR